MDGLSNCGKVTQRDFYYLSSNGGDMKSSAVKGVQFQSPFSQLDCKISLEVVTFECDSVMKIVMAGGK
jgi:hypothetical protein